MTHHERMALTPLEMTVWAAAFAREYSLATADKVVEELRNKLKYEREAELQADAKSLHTVVAVQSTAVASFNTLRCSCGYRPHGREQHDVEELMAIHLAHVRALTPGETR